MHKVRAARRTVLKGIDDLAGFLKEPPSVASYRLFKLHEAISVLSGEEERFRYEKMMALTGLCAWMVAPGQYDFIESEVLRFVASATGLIERNAMKRRPELGYLAAVASQIEEKNASLFAALYSSNGFNGRIGTLAAGSGADRKSKFMLLKANIPNLMNLMRLIHYHTERIAQLYPPDFPWYTENLSKFESNLYKMKSASKSQTMNALKELKDALPLLYAADSMITNDGSTFLVKLLGKMDETNPSKLRPFMARGELLKRVDELFGKAKYVEESILPHVNTKKGYFNKKLESYPVSIAFPSVDIKDRDHRMIFDRYINT